MKILNENVSRNIMKTLTESINYNKDYNERIKYLLGDISDTKEFAKLLMSEFKGSINRYNPEFSESDSYNRKEGCNTVDVGGTRFYISKDYNDIWCYDYNAKSTMSALLCKDKIKEFLTKEGIYKKSSDTPKYWTGSRWARLPDGFKQ